MQAVLEKENEDLRQERESLRLVKELIEQERGSAHLAQQRAEKEKERLQLMKDEAERERGIAHLARQKAEEEQVKAQKEWERKCEQTASSSSSLTPRTVQAMIQASVAEALERVSSAKPESIASGPKRSEKGSDQGNSRKALHFDISTDSDEEPIRKLQSHASEASEPDRTSRQF